MSFLDKNYLLPTSTSRDIFASIVDLPVLDAHNHCDVKALSENQNFTDIWDAEAATDHYVWECLRKCNVPEEKITGNQYSNQEKWRAMAAVFEDFAGNPTYEWIQLDLRRRPGIDLKINNENADAIWNQSKKLLNSPAKAQQQLIKEMNVETMCSTDDPVDTLEYHQKLQKDSLIKGVVRPTFRPDKAMNIYKPEWNDYITALGKRWNVKIDHVSDLLNALQQAHNFFAENGCIASDHGVNVPYGYDVDAKTADSVFTKARKGEVLSHGEQITYMSFFLNEVAEMDAKKNWVFQLHIGAVRDARKSLYDSLGADVGGDISDHNTDYTNALLPLLNRFDGRLKIVLYNMNPIHNATLAQITRAFGHTVSLGLAWWLNDSYCSMKRQLEYCGTVDVLSNMAGMVSDSRKILSYGSRFELFRRTLSNVLGESVNLGQMREESALRLAHHLAYERPKALFGI